MKPFYILIFLMATSLVTIAQSPDGLERCGTDEYHATLMQDSVYAAQHVERVKTVEQYLKDNPHSSKAQCDEILYIPVAVHFENVQIDMDCAIQMSLSQIEILNKDFSGTNDDINKWQEGKPLLWPQIQNDQSCIVFCLATMDHPGGYGLANGDYAVTLNQLPDDADNAPDWTGYINFFVRPMTNPLGYSPLNGSGFGDGVTCGVNYFGSISCGGNTIAADYHLGRTTTHELGHYLGLNHPFNNTDCAVDGDGIADTPITNAPTYGCPAIGTELINCTDPILWPTYMEYCSDACLYMFTKGQIAVMDTYVQTGLAHLLNSAKIKCSEAACLDFAVAVQATQETCKGDDGKIILSASGGLPPYEYSINGGQTSYPEGNFTTLKTGTYEVLVTDKSGCTYTRTIDLKVERPTISVVSTQSSFCGDNSGSITVEVNNEGTFQYMIKGKGSWQDSPMFENLTYGTYEIHAKSTGGCESSMQITVQDDTDLTLQINTVRPVNCPLFDNGLIDLNVLGGEDPVVWILNQNTITERGYYENLSPGEYFIEVKDNRGCRITRNFNIAVSYLDVAPDCPCDVFIPNAMTPDGDGLNDLLEIVPSCPITEFHMRIFDRWGRMVFESFDLRDRWNGGIDEYYTETSVFFYRLTYRWGEQRNESLEVQQKSGTITILR